MKYLWVRSCIKCKRASSTVAQHVKPLPVKPLPVTLASFMGTGYPNYSTSNLASCEWPEKAT